MKLCTHVSTLYPGHMLLPHFPLHPGHLSNPYLTPHHQMVLSEPPSYDSILPSYLPISAIIYNHQCYNRAQLSVSLPLWCLQLFSQDVFSEMTSRPITPILAPAGHSQWLPEHPERHHVSLPWALRLGLLYVCEYSSLSLSSSPRASDLLLFVKQDQLFPVSLLQPLSTLSGPVFL